MFKKWYTACFKTYADVFIRLAAIYFALYLINLLTKNPDAFTINGRPLGLAETLFVILGILMFAKQFPDLLKDLLGIDLKGNFTLNPMKKIGENAPLAAAALGLGAGALGGIAGNFLASRQTHSGFLKGLKHTVGGAFTGAARGAHAGYDSKGSKLFSSSWNAAGKGGQNIINKQGTSLVGRNTARVQTGLGIHTKADRLDAESKKYKEMEELRKQIRSVADYDDQTRGNIVVKGANGSTRMLNGVNVKDAKQALEDAINGGASEARVTELRENYEAIRADAIADPGQNVQIASLMEKANRLVDDNKDLSGFKNTGPITDDKSLTGAMVNAQKANTELTNSKEWDRAHANQSYAKTGSSGKK